MSKRFYTLLMIFLLAAGSATIVKAAEGLSRVRMGVILPLKERTPRGQKMVEFYQGMLMAVDSMKHKGLSVDVVAMHSGATASEMDALLNSTSLADCDIIFGPLDGQQIPILSDYCDIHGIRLVVPFSSITNHLTGRPLQYVISAPRYNIQQSGAWFLGELFNNCHFVMVDTKQADSDGAAFAEQVRTTLNKKGLFARQLPIDGDDMAFETAINPLRRNVIVLNSSTIKAINALLPRLKDYKQQHPDVQLTLFGYPSWQTYTSQLLTDFYQFDTHIFTTFYRNPLERHNRDFENSFLGWFHRPMGNTFPRYGTLGFDLAYFFLSGLSTYGEELESNLGSMHIQPLQTPLSFTRYDEENGFINTFVEIVHYTTAQSIELMTRQ